MTRFRDRIWRRHYAIPPEHGSWIWWIGPFVVGLAAGGRAGSASVILALAVFGAFLLRQPVVILVKIVSGRRARRELTPALFWLGVYGTIELGLLAWLVVRGHARILWLGLPGMSVFVWHLWLVTRRAERGQRAIELVGSGVLALAAPASYWVAGGDSSALAWTLWILMWLQSAASIVLVYHRLARREWPSEVGPGTRLLRGSRTLGYHIFNLAYGIGLSRFKLFPWPIILPLALMLIDALQAVLSSKTPKKPSRIGIRQLVMSSIFALGAALVFHLF
jgi:hypothetical protein